MKNLLHKLQTGRDVTVVQLDRAIIRCGRFRRTGGGWKAVSLDFVNVENGNAAAALKRACDIVGNGDFSVLCGNVNNTVFFRFRSQEMPAAAQRSAVEFELPRKVFNIPERYKFQFLQHKELPGEDGVWVNVALFPEQDLADIYKVIRDSGCFFDEFIYPFLAYPANGGVMALPDVEPEFFFSGNQWLPTDGEERSVGQSLALQEKILLEKFIFDEKQKAVVRDNLSLLNTAALVTEGVVQRSPGAFKVLPDKLRPVRYRKHLIVSAMLGVLLLIVAGWRFFLAYGTDISEYRELTAKSRKVKSSISEMKLAVKRNSKEFKEMLRVVGTSVGEAEVLGEFALLSEILPSDVMVSSIRWSDADIDMVLQCENDRLDMAALIQPLKRWKIIQLQQRQNGDSAVATITVKLAPLNDKRSKK